MESLAQTDGNVKPAEDDDECEENKQFICDCLLNTLQETQDMMHLVSLTYEGSKDLNYEVVLAKFEDGRGKRIRVTGDSEFSMIRDIVDHIDK